MARSVIRSWITGSAPFIDRENQTNSKPVTIAVSLLISVLELRMTGYRLRSGVNVSRSSDLRPSCSPLTPKVVKHSVTH